jgi:hypothetical protein
MSNIIRVTAVNTVLNQPSDVLTLLVGVDGYDMIVPGVWYGDWRLRDNILDPIPFRVIDGRKMEISGLTHDITIGEAPVVIGNEFLFMNAKFSLLSKYKITDIQMYGN